MRRSIRPRSRHGRGLFCRPFVAVVLPTIPHISAPSGNFSGSFQRISTVIVVEVQTV